MITYLVNLRFIIALVEDFWSMIKETYGTNALKVELATIVKCAI